MSDPLMSASQQLRAKLKGGERCLGGWVTLDHPAIAEIFARAGFDWLVIDLEHSAIGTGAAAELIRVVDLCGCVPLVRLTSNDPDQIKRSLDAGAHGIVVPMVNSADDARRAVAATRYAPEGVRGVGLGRAQGYGARFADYWAWQTEGPLVIVQIEHRDAVAALDDILAVSGVDAFIVGPYDLTCSLGVAGQFEHPAYRDARTRILECGRRAGRPAGLHVVEPDPGQLDAAWRDGFTFVAYSVDIRMLDRAARAVTGRG